MLLVMSAAPRKPRGKARSNPAIFAQVEPHIKEKWNAMVEATGVSHVRLMEEIVARMDLDAQGRPVWWPDVDDSQGELPMKSA